MPFSEKINSKIKKFKNIFLINKNILITKVQEYRLNLFLGVCFTRLERKKLLKDSILEISDIEAYPFLKILGDSKNKYKVELQNIYLFCYVENFIDEVADWKINLEVDKCVDKISEIFLKRLEKTACICINTEWLLILKKELFRINRKWLYFHFQESTFVFDSQKSYFQEIYCKSDALVRFFLESEIVENLYEYDEEKIKIYYDYLFLITTVVPTKFIEDVIYICVDFSHGKFYNEFIRKSIESFQNLNTVFEKKLRLIHKYIYLTLC
ncbi:TPA: hypothetical protein ACIZC1_002792 [Enterococcus faecalis]